MFIFFKAVFLLGLVGFAAFFSGAETALTGLSRMSLERLDKVFPGKLKFWRDRPDRVLACLLLGTNMAVIGVGVVTTSLAVDLAAGGFGSLKVLLLTLPLFSAFLVLILGEIIPKISARLSSDVWALKTSRSLEIFYDLTTFLTEGLVRASNRLIGLMGVRRGGAGSLLSAEQIKEILSDSHISHPARFVLHNILDFGRATAQQVMVPREEIFSVDLRQGREKVIAAIIQSGYSRVPAHRGSLDHLEGIIYSKDLLAMTAKGDLIVLEDILRPALKLPIKTPLATALRQFKKGEHHLAVIVDKSGRVRGLLTIQDVLESIAGKQ